MYRKIQLAAQVSEADILRFKLGELDGLEIGRAARRYGFEDGSLTYHGKKVPTADDRMKWLEELHVNLGHLTKTALSNVISTEYDWESRAADIEAVVSSCVQCQHGFSNARTPETHKSNMVGIRRNNRLFDEWSVDLIELPITRLKNRYCLVMVESISGWPEAIPLHSKNSKEVASAIFHILSRYGSSRDCEVIGSSSMKLWKLLLMCSILITQQVPHTTQKAIHK
eukprot:TRINITY_DN486_c1_g1_i2.p1 TRINITY_DN486_c1_g1~~TRINITY_DN486_c1_g1_i2.p1  ORF type:complete len:226 (+),score=35.08 TRINITY_DN486_c1_g1_i2:123-800(+)